MNSPAASTSSASGEGTYWLWDSNQQPVYQKVADAFHAANPNITVKITQYSWDDYWTNVTNGFVAGTAPDVFTNHLSKYPEFVTQGQLLSLDDALKADGIKTDIYLAAAWVRAAYGMERLARAVASRAGVSCSCSGGDA